MSAYSIAPHADAPPRSHFSRDVLISWAAHTLEFTDDGAEVTLRDPTVVSAEGIAEEEVASLARMPIVGIHLYWGSSGPSEWLMQLRTRYGLPGQILEHWSLLPGELVLSVSERRARHASLRYWPVDCNGIAVPTSGCWTVIVTVLEDGTRVRHLFNGPRG